MVADAEHEVRVLPHFLFAPLVLLHFLSSAIAHDVCHGARMPEPSLASSQHRRGRKTNTPLSIAPVSVCAQTFTAMEGDSTSASSDEEDSGVSGVDHGVFISVDDIDPTVGTKSRPSLAEILVTGGGDGETTTSLATHSTTHNFAALISPVHSSSMRIYTSRFSSCPYCLFVLVGS
jgi:hypothetical protein